MENKEMLTISENKEDFNYLNLFPKNLTIKELFLSMGISGLYFKITVRNN